MSSTKFIARNGLAVGTSAVDVVDSAGELLINAPTASKLLTARTISLSGDVVGSVSFDGSGNAAIATTIQADSVALGTDTTGNYMLNVSAGTGVSVSHTQSEGSTATVSIGQAVGTTDNVTFNNVTVSGTLTSDDITSTNISVAGNATITGNLTVSGTTTTINSTTIAIADLNLELARNATTAAAANGAGITVTGPATPATLTYTSADDRWNLNKNLNVTTVFGALNGTIGATTAAAGAFTTVSATGSIQGQASAAFKTNSGSGQYYHFDNATGNNFMGLDAANTVRIYAGGALSSTFTSTGQAVTGTLSATGTLSGGTSGTGYSFSGSAPATSLTLNSSGNLGIGTSSPVAPLHVFANSGDMLRLDRNNTGAVGNQIAFRHSNAGTLTETASINAISTANADTGTLAFYTKPTGGVSTERARIDSSGNVGIGTSSVGGYTLHISNATPTVRISGTSETAGQTQSLYFGTTTYNRSEIRSINVGTQGSDLTFLTSPSASSSVERMRITSAGNVGIGNTAPSYKLQVGTAAATAASVLSALTPVLYVDGGSTANSSIVIKTHNGGSGTVHGAIRLAVSPDAANYSWSGMAGIADVNGAASTLAFYTASDNSQGTAAGASTERMRITSTGMGIGTTSPAYKLNLYSDTTGDGMLVDVLSNPTIILRDRGNSDTTIGTGAGAGLDNFYISTYSGIGLVMNGATRNVGIGTSSPNFKLDVGPQGGAQSSTTGSQGAIRNNASADLTPFTQSRIIVYGGVGVDTGNWGYFGYGSDASLRIVYGKTGGGAPLIFGTTSAMDGTGTLTTTMALTMAGALAFGSTTAYGTSGQVLQSNGNAAPTWVNHVTSITATTPIVTSAATGAITLSHATSGVTAGTYNNVTVNTFGHVTSGSNVAYLTALSDTLATVTGRGASTSTASTFSGGLTASSVLATSNLFAGSATTGVTRGVISNDGTFTSFYAAESTARIQLGRDVGVGGGAGLALGGSTYALIAASDTAGTALHFKLSAAASTGTTSPNMTLNATGLSLSGTIGASNFSGSHSGASSGTNTGDNPGVTAVTAVTPIVSSGGTTPSISHATSGATAGTYNNVTVNTFGHVTAGSNVGYTSNTGTVTSVATSGGYGGLTLTGGTITTTGTITMGGTPTGTWPISVSGSAATATNATFYRQFTMRDDRSDGGDYSLANRPTGLYAISGAGTNGPGPTYQSLIHVANGSDVAFQIAGGYQSDNMYFRGTSALQNGTGYSSWRTVWHNGNLTNLNQLTNGPGYGTGTVTAVTATTPIASSGGTTPNITHVTSGATAGTYNNVTVNTFGHVTAGSNVAYLTAEADTLATVTARGASTSTFVVFKVASNVDINVANDTGSFSVRGDTTYPASISFHRAGAYAINMGLSTANEFVIGGWSASSNAFKLTGAGAGTFLSTITASNFSGSHSGTSSGTNTGDNPGVTAVTAVTPIVSSGGTTPSISHATSGVTAATYNNVTVNTFGHVTSGSNVAYLTAEADTLATVTARGSSTTGAITISSGGIRRGSHSSGFLEGSYNNIGGNSTNTNPIYTIGSAYNPTDSSLSNMYGIGYSHPNFWGGGKGADWGFYVAQAGTVMGTFGCSTGLNTWINGYGVSTSSWRAPIFYDSDNTSYYIDAASTSVMNRISTVRTNDWLYLDNNYGHSVVGVYDATKFQGVFAMGDSYKLTAAGAISGLYGMTWSHTNAGGIAGNLDSHGLIVAINGGFGSCMSYSIKASGNVTAYSDERLKTNWRDMPESYVSKLAKVKVGIYDRMDGEKLTQVGVSAQSLQTVLPEAVITADDDIKTLSVNYGGAALASAVELAKDNIELRGRIEKLEALVYSLLNKE